MLRRWSDAWSRDNDRRRGWQFWLATRIHYRWNTRTPARTLLRLHTQILAQSSFHANTIVAWTQHALDRDASVAGRLAWHSVVRGLLGRAGKRRAMVLQFAH